MHRSLEPPSEGAAVRLLRRRRGWTQSNLAKNSGLSQPTIVGIEKSLVIVKESVRAKICQALEVSPDDFSQIAKDAHRSKPEVNWIIPPHAGDGGSLKAEEVVKLLGITTEAAYMTGHLQITVNTRGEADALARNLSKRWKLGLHSPVGEMSTVLGHNGILLVVAAVDEPGCGIIRLTGQSKLRIPVIIVDERVGCPDRRMQAAEMLCAYICRNRTENRGRKPETAPGRRHFASLWLLPDELVKGFARRMKGNPSPTAILVCVSLLADYASVPIQLAWTRLRGCQSALPEILPEITGDAVSYSDKRLDADTDWLRFIRSIAPPGAKPK